MIWAGFGMLAVAALFALWQHHAYADWIVTDALIVDYKEIRGSEGEIAYQPIVQMTDARGERMRVPVPLVSHGSRRGGSLVVRHAPGIPQRILPVSHIFHAFPIGLAIFGVIAICQAVLS